MLVRWDFGDGLRGGMGLGIWRTGLRSVGPFAETSRLFEENPRCGSVDWAFKDAEGYKAFGFF